MLKNLRSFLAVFFSMLLCLSGIPATALAETMAEVNPTVAESMETQGDQQADKAVEWRTHAKGSQPLAPDAEWHVFQSANTTEITSASDTEPALDMVEVRLTNETPGLRYRVRDNAGVWQDAWIEGGTRLECADGITDIAFSLSDELDATHDLWWRTRTVGGQWSTWRNAPAAQDLEPALDETLPLLADLQVTLVKQGQQAPDNATQNNADATEPSGDTQPAPAQPTPAQPAPAQPAPAQPAGDAGQEKSVDETAKDADATDKGTPNQAPAADTTAADAQPAPTKNDKQGAETTAKDQPETDDKLGMDAKAPATSTTELVDESEGIVAQAATPEIEYRAHVQNDGWQGWVKNGAMAGTSGKSYRVEGFYLRLKNADGQVHYQTHVQNIGWQPEHTDNQMAGTQGRSLRVEAMKIWLSGNIANHYDVWYRGHVENIGWQGWVKNGAVAGTSGQSLRVEAIEIMLVEKGGAVPTGAGSSYKGTPQSSSPSIYYQGHVQNIGWQDEVGNGAVCGTSGKSYRVEALRIATRGIDGGVTYSAHVQNIGWQDYRSNGDVAGTSGQSLRLEALKVALTGNAKYQYDVYYRTHVQNIGWMAWAKNGELAGTSGFSYRMEAVQIKLQAKGTPAPSNNDANNSLPFIDSSGVSVIYNASLQGSGWQGNRKDGETAGKTGVSARVQLMKATLSDTSHGGIQYSLCRPNGSWTNWASNNGQCGEGGTNPIALRMRLTGDYAALYRAWYRVHIANVGWLDWTSDGAAAGNDSPENPIEAFEVRVLPRENGAPGSTATPFYHSQRLNGVDISGWNRGINIAGLDADFVIIKATEGVHGTIYNPYYASWADQSLALGKMVGFYHYANGGSAIAEADSFYEAIKGYRGRAIACLDWEGQGNPTFNSGQDVAWCKTFLDRLRSRFGGTPFIYTSKSVTNSYDWSSVAGSYPLWGAQYASNNPVYGYQSDPWQSSSKWGAWGRFPTIFQYSGNGKLARNGGSGSLDLNLFYGSRDDWRHYIG